MNDYGSQTAASRVGLAPQSDTTINDRLSHILVTIHACDDAVQLIIGKVLGEQLDVNKDNLKNPQASVAYYVDRINEAAHQLNEKILHLQGRIG